MRDAALLTLLRSAGHEVFEDQCLLVVGDFRALLHLVQAFAQPLLTDLRWLVERVATAAPFYVNPPPFGQFF